MKKGKVGEIYKNTCSANKYTYVFEIISIDPKCEESYEVKIIKSNHNFFRLGTQHFFNLNPYDINVTEVYNSPLYKALMGEDG